MIFRRGRQGASGISLFSFGEFVIIAQYTILNILIMLGSEKVQIYPRLTSVTVRGRSRRSSAVLNITSTVRIYYYCYQYTLFYKNIFYKNIGVNIFNFFLRVKIFLFFKIFLKHFDQRVN